MFTDEYLRNSFSSIWFFERVKTSRPLYGVTRLGFNPNRQFPRFYSFYPLIFTRPLVITSFHSRIASFCSVISLHPFDFPISYIHSKGESLPYSNHNFIFFGEDSISSLFCKQYIKKTIEKLKQHIYFNIDDFIDNKINNNSKI